MGNYSECCCKPINRADFTQCRDLSSLSDLLRIEFTKAQIKVKKIQEQKRREVEASNMEIRSDEIKRNYYYLKLEVLLLKVKSLIEECVMAENVLKAKRSNDSAISENVFSILEVESDIKKSKKKFSTTDIRQIPIMEDKKLTLQSISLISTENSHQNLKRRTKKSQTTKESVRIKKKLDLSECIRLINDIYDTEESLDSESLTKIEHSLEIRMFDMSFCK
jgi:hypothetical protein